MRFDSFRCRRKKNYYRSALCYDSNEFDYRTKFNTKSKWQDRDQNCIVNRKKKITWLQEKSRLKKEAKRE